MTTRELRHATVRNMLKLRTPRIARIAHRVGWLIEVRGVPAHLVARRLSRWGTANQIRPIVIQYEMTKRFVLAGVADTEPRNHGNIISKGVREARGASYGK